MNAPHFLGLLRLVASVPACHVTGGQAFLTLPSAAATPLPPWQVAVIGKPPPFYQLIPRMSYLPFYLPDVRNHFAPAAVKLGQDKARMWLSHNNAPVKWCALPPPAAGLVPSPWAPTTPGLGTGNRNGSLFLVPGCQGKSKKGHANFLLALLNCWPLGGSSLTLLISPKI